MYITNIPKFLNEFIILKQETSSRTLYFIVSTITFSFSFVNTIFSVSFEEMLPNN